MNAVVVGLSVLLALVMFNSFLRNVRGDPASEQLRERLQVGPRLWRVVGVLELCAAIGLLVGLALGPLGVAAAVGIALLMLGAVLLHLRVRVAGLALAAPLAVLLVGTTTAALRFATL